MKRLKPIHSQYMPSYFLCSTHVFSFCPSNNLTNIFSSGGEKRSNNHVKASRGETAAGVLAAERTGRDCKIVLLKVLS